MTTTIASTPYITHGPPKSCGQAGSFSSGLEPARPAPMRPIFSNFVAGSALFPQNFPKFRPRGHDGNTPERGLRHHLGILGLSQSVPEQPKALIPDDLPSQPSTSTSIPAATSSRFEGLRKCGRFGAARVAMAANRGAGSRAGARFGCGTTCARVPGRLRNMESGKKWQRKCCSHCWKRK